MSMQKHDSKTIVYEIKLEPRVVERRARYLKSCYEYR